MDCPQEGARVVEVRLDRTAANFIDQRARELRYMLRLYAKELVLENFPGYERGELLERMIELSLYAEEHLR